MFIVFSALFSILLNAQTAKGLPVIKGTTVSIPVEEFSKFVSDAKISLPWADFEKFLTAEAGIKHITIPWEILLKYIEPAMTTKPVKPPVDYIVSSFFYTGEPEGNFCTLKFSGNLVILKNPSDGWTTIKLWPSSQVFVSDVSFNGKPVNVYSSDGNYQIITNEQGSFTIEGKLQIRLYGENLRFTPIPNTSSVLKLKLPKDYQISSSYVSTIKVNHTVDKTEAELVFAPGSSIEANWTLISKEPSESKIFANALISSYIQTDLLKTNASIRYEILYQPVRFLKILMPEGSRLNNISGNFLEWKLTDSTIQIELKPDTKGSMNIDVSYEQELKPDTQEVIIKNPVIVDAEKITGYLTISTATNLGVSVSGYEGLSMIDPREVPLASISTALAFRFNQIPFIGSLKITRYEEMPILEATCDSANAITAVTLDGKTITRVIYHIRNNAKQFLTVKLPEKSQIWSVYIANSPVKPLAGKSGSVLIPLRRTSVKTDSALPIEIIYFQPGVGFGKIGDFQINLPAIDVPIMHLMYSLYIPEKLMLDTFGGNLEKVDNFSISAETVPVGKSVGKEETSKKPSSISQSEIYLVQQSALERNVAAGIGDKVSQPSNAPETVGGFLPLRIYIPTTGKLLRFEKKLVMDENIFLKARYKLSSR